MAAQKRMAVRNIVLIIPAYNEATVIAHTIRTALKAGMDKRDIFVVDDNSSDKTRSIAISILGRKNVMTVERSGKGLAISKIVEANSLTKR